MTVARSYDAVVIDLGAGVDRATRLVEQLLTLARNEPGSRQALLKPLDLGALVQQALADSATLALARGARRNSCERRRYTPCSRGGSC